MASYSSRGDQAVVEERLELAHPLGAGGAGGRGEGHAAGAAILLGRRQDGVLELAAGGRCCGTRAAPVSLAVSISTSP